VFVEYAKGGPSDVLIQISATNRGPETAALHVLPTLWFRNTSTWWPDQPKPSMREAQGEAGIGTIHASHARIGHLPALLRGQSAAGVTENDTNNERIFGSPNASPYVKDGIHNYVVSGRHDAVTPTRWALRPLPTTSSMSQPARLPSSA
jgi:hypothetical protein